MDNMENLEEIAAWTGADFFSLCSQVAIKKERTQSNFVKQKLNWRYFSAKKKSIFQERKRTYLY
jgi:hypothetical protein